MAPLQNLKNCLIIKPTTAKVGKLLLMGDLHDFHTERGKIEKQNVRSVYSLLLVSSRGWGEVKSTLGKDKCARKEKENPEIQTFL